MAQEKLISLNNLSTFKDNVDVLLDEKVKQVKVGTTEYNPTDGVVSLPAYPTSLPASNTTDTYSSTGTDPVSGKAVNAALGTLDVTGESNISAGKTIKSWSETDGKVSVTTQDISITKSQVSDFPTLGTAAAKDVPATGNASTTQVVMGNDTRLSDARPASDVSAWAKASTKPSYTASEVGLGNVTNNKQIKGLASGTTENHVVTFGTDGYTVKDSGFTIGKSVPSDAKFTDTTYSNATTAVAGLMSTDDKSKLNGIASGAEVNQNAFSNVKVGSTTVAADAKTDTIELVQGSNITLTPDATNDKITIAATNTTYSNATTAVAGLMSAADKAKVDALGTAANKDVPSSGNASTAQVVMGNDTRLSDSRNAKDVYSWAKAASKPSYTASEVGAIATSAKGAASGVAELDANGKVPAAQLPSYVDDVLEYTSKSAFPTTGETGKIYVATDTNLTYRWSGSAYVEISPSLALGETSSTAYRGDRGKTAYDHSQATGNPHGTTKANVGLGNVANIDQSKAIKSITRSGTTFTATALDGTTSSFTQQDNNTTYSNATTAAAGLMSKDDKIKLNGIAAGATANTGTVTSVGLTAGDGIAVSGGPVTTSGSITVSNKGVRSIATGGSNGTINVNTNGSTANVAVKGLGSAAYTASTDYATNTTLANQDLNNVITPGFYNASGGNTCANKPSGIDAFGLEVIHSAAGTYYTQIIYSNTSSVPYRRNCNNGTWSSWTLDKYTDTNTTYSAGSNITLSGTQFSLTKANVTGALGYTPPTTDTNTTYTFANGTNGFTVTPSGGTAQTVTVTPSITNNVTGSGTSGYIAKFNGGNTITNGPAIGSDTTKYLRNDGTWVKPPNDNTWTAMVGATSAANGSVGYVNATPPKDGYNTKYLRADGTWTVPPNDNTTYSNATTAKAGLMSTADKTKLDGIYSGANAVTIAESSSNGNIKVTTNGSTANVPIHGLGSAAYTASTAYAGSGHTHTTSMATSSGTNQITLAANTKYAITAGGTSYVFTTPPDTNTWRGIQNNLTSDSTTDSLSAAQGKALKGLVDGKAASGHTHTTNMTTSSGTSALTLNSNTKYSINAGGTSYIITTPSGVRSVATGTSNGTINVNTNGTTADVPVKGLGSAAYTASTAYAASGHNHDSTYLKLSGGTLTGQLKFASTGYRTSNDNGYSTDEYGNFKSLSNNSGNCIHFDDYNGNQNVKIFWSSGNINTTGSIGAAGSISGGESTFGSVHIGGGSNPAFIYSENNDISFRYSVDGTTGSVGYTTVKNLVNDSINAAKYVGYLNSGTLLSVIINNASGRSITGLMYGLSDAPTTDCEYDFIVIGERTRATVYAHKYNSNGLYKRTIFADNWHDSWTQIMSLSGNTLTLNLI